MNSITIVGKKRIAITTVLVIIALLFFYVVFNIHFTTNTSNELLKGLIVIVGFVIITLIISFLVDEKPSKFIKSLFLPLALVGIALASDNLSFSCVGIRTYK